MEHEKKEEEGLAYRDRSIDALDIALLDQDFHGLETQRLDLRLLEGLASFQLLNLPVQLRHFFFSLLSLSSS